MKDARVWQDSGLAPSLEHQSTVYTYRFCTGNKLPSLSHSPLFYSTNFLAYFEGRIESNRIESNWTKVNVDIDTTRFFYVILLWRKDLLTLEQDFSSVAFQSTPSGIDRPRPETSQAFCEFSWVTVERFRQKPNTSYLYYIYIYSREAIYRGKRKASNIRR